MIDDAGQNADETGETQMIDWNEERKIQVYSRNDCRSVRDSEFESEMVYWANVTEWLSGVDEQPYLAASDG